MRTQITVVVMMALNIAGSVWGGAPEAARWYPFKPTSENGPSVIGMEDWLEKPAGNRGGVKMVGDHFELGDGTPIKFWGVNLGNMDCAPEKEQADFWAGRWARYGINAVRLHKFINPGGSGIGDPEDSTKFDPKKIEDLDYFTSQLARHGIYHGWSHSYHYAIRPGDKDKLLAYDEIRGKDGKGADTYGLMNVAPDVQDVMIASVVALLKHKNAHTGKTYAQDPTLCFIEMQNEDDVFFYTITESAVRSKPTYHKDLLRRYNEWLKGKYGTPEKLLASWGEKALNAFNQKDEDPTRWNMDLALNGWSMGPEGLKQADGLGTRRRLLDNARFLYETQLAFYKKFEKAIRDAGYTGPLVGSCWGSAGGITQYYNILADYNVGFIDRHNYFGGLGGWKYQTGKFKSGAMVNLPGIGLLSTGFQQVVDRPFAISEWASVAPNEWGAEAPAIMATYGMGLQGWDASYQFASATRAQRGFQTALNKGTNLWLIEVPNQIGFYPNLARMIYRGDVKEAPPVAVRRVSIDDLHNGRLNFDESYKQEGDFKEIGGQVPPATLAAGRVVAQFVEKSTPSEFADMGKFLKDGVITSTTGQLRWDASRPDKGFFTVNTPGTKAVVGFAGDRPQVLGNITVSTASPFAVIYITSLEKTGATDKPGRILLTAMARNRNTGMRFNAAGDTLEEIGQGPIVMEPVKATIKIDGVRIQSIRLLDHDGRPTDKTLPADGGQFTIDQEKDQTPYYEIQLGAAGAAETG